MEEKIKQAEYEYQSALASLDRAFTESDLEICRARVNRAAHRLADLLERK